MLQPLDVEHCLASLSRSIPTLQWWGFELSKPDHRKHLWISLPADVEVVCGKTSLLPKNAHLLGRLNILHWGADCLVQGVRITPSEKDQIVCIETRASDQDPRIFWIDANQLVVTISPNGIQEIVDTSRPTQPLLGSHIWGWLSGLKVRCSQSQSITERCFLIPVDFSNRDDDIAVLLSHNKRRDRVKICAPASPSRKLIVVNPRTNELYSFHLDSMPTCQTYSPFGVSDSCQFVWQKQNSKPFRHPNSLIGQLFFCNKCSMAHSRVIGSFGCSDGDNGIAPLVLNRSR